jgi:hexosaminidase
MMLLAWAPLVVSLASIGELPNGIKLWPIPRHIDVVQGSRKIPISQNISISLVSSPAKDGVMARGAARFDILLRGQATANTSAVQIVTIRVEVLTTDEHLGLNTDYSYQLHISAGTSVYITANSSYGALYGLETFAQLTSDGYTQQEITIQDAPMYRHRGLMLDTGRRFHPVALVKSMLDGMALVKLNILHFHLSDQCRFSIESKRYPALTANLTGLQAGHYSQDDIRDLVTYAGDRGIRVIPEFDVPGHTGGWGALKSQGE